METITALIQDVPIPKMYKIRQKFDETCIPRDQIPSVITAQLDRPDLGGKILPGQSIAIGCGSRGIHDYALMVKTMVDYVKSKGATPFIVPAMGSHGGATPEGQRQVLADYGVSEETMGCAVKSSLETVVIGHTAQGNKPVSMDRYAYEADGILLFNRVKPHTSFRGRYESGLMKMMAIGLGKQRGANEIHGQNPDLMPELVAEYGRTVLAHAPILGGIAVVENAYDYTFKIQGLTPQEIITEEPKLRDLSYTTIARLLFDSCDVLVVDKIGKNISGDGMDPNITGRFCTDVKGGIDAEKVVVLDLTEETHGNAHGMGLADATTRRLFNRMKMEMTYPTGVTNTFLMLMKIPMVMDNDREALQVALCSCPKATDPDNKKLIRIQDTAHIEYIEISQGLLPQALAHPDIEVLSEGYDLVFDENGNLF